MFVFQRLFWREWLWMCFCAHRWSKVLWWHQTMWCQMQI